MSSFKIKFTVKSIMLRNDYFAAIMGNKITCDNVRIKKEIKKQMEIRGQFPLSLCQDDMFEAIVEKKIDKRNSNTYLTLITEPKRIGLERNNALAKFIQQRINNTPKQNTKLNKWKIPLTTCNEIVKILGLDAISKMIDNPIDLLNYPHLKLTDEKVFELQNIFKKCETLQKISVVLQSSGLSLQTALNLYESYGNDTLSVIRDNPYQICYDDKITFKIADKLAYDLHFDSHNTLRIKTAILSFMDYKKNDGNICILKTDFYSKDKNKLSLNSYLNIYGVYKNNNITQSQIDEEIELLLKDNKLVREVDYNTEYIYLPDMHMIEERLVLQVKELLDNSYNQKFCDMNYIDDFLADYETSVMQLDILQKKAVQTALQNKLFILTGGPGTGKTATVNVIVKAIKSISMKLYKRKANIILLAPTGKAAERMTELTNELSSTIHRGLNISYKSGPQEELDADFVIVDESSMIDVFLMLNLLNSLTERTRILFVGDVNQLPSVGPGKILSDFINSGVIKYVELKTIFRQAQGSAIVSNANKIVSGLDSKQVNGIELTNDPNKNFKFIQEQSTDIIKNLIIDKIDEYLRNGRKLSDICILTAMRKGELGVETLNSILQEIYNTNPIYYENKNKDIIFKVGDKIIQTKNNYNLKVFNGYIGTIVDIDNNNVVNGSLKPTITVEYDNMNNPVTYMGEDIQELDLAYALTIHKSQGSEYPIVISPIHSEQNILLNRNLLYTDVTRAKEEFILIGDEKAVNKAINTEMTENERISRITYKISTMCA